MWKMIAQNNVFCIISVQTFFIYFCFRLNAKIFWRCAELSMRKIISVCYKYATYRLHEKKYRKMSALEIHYDMMPTKISLHCLSHFIWFYWRMNFTLMYFIYHKILTHKGKMSILMDMNFSKNLVNFHYFFFVYINTTRMIL